MQNKTLKNDERAVFALRSLYDRFGYERFKMNRFEEYDLYVRNKDFLVSDQVITFTDHSGRLLALKPDVTLSIIKNTKDTPGVVQKLYYNENVYRVASGSHSFKEIMQVGLECIGDLGAYETAEVVLLAAESLALISDKFMLDISHMGLVSAVLESSGLSDSGKGKALSCLHQKNSHELRSLCAQEQIPAGKLIALAECAGSLEQIGSLLTTEAEKESLSQLQRLCDILSANGYDGRVQVDFSVGNDLKYYSGVVFNGYIEGIPTSVLSGGQYDKLLKKMGRKSSAIGFAFYVDLLERMAEKKEEFDIDTVLLHDGTEDPAWLVKMAQEAGRSGSVLVTTGLPEHRTWRRAFRLQNGEAVSLENNG